MGIERHKSPDLGARDSAHLSQNASAADRERIEPLLRFARSAHEAGGYPANELEPRITELAKSLGLNPVQVYASPTVVILTVGPTPHQQVHVLRVNPRPVNLHAIGRLDEIAAAVADGHLDRRRVLKEIEQLGQEPLRRPIWIMVGAHSLVAAALAPILGGGWRESLGAATVGLVVGILIRVLIRSDRSGALLPPLGAFLASFLASALANAGFDFSVSNATFAALIVFFPGMPMAMGVRELASGDLQAGLANSASALVRLVGLVFGVALGRSLATTWLGPTPINIPDPFPQGVDIVAAALVGLAFVVTLRAPARDAIWTCSAPVLAIIANFIASRFLGSIAGAFAAALVMGLAGNVIARHFRRSPLVFIVPGILMLVPGSIGYESASRLMAGQTVLGVDTAVDTFVTMLAIAYGLMVSTILLPDQRVMAGGGRLGRTA